MQKKKFLEDFQTGHWDEFQMGPKALSGISSANKVFKGIRFPLEGTLALWVERSIRGVTENFAGTFFWSLWGLSPC